jgi:thymidylate synthase (FAD)
MLRLARNTYPLLFAQAGPPCLKGRCPEGAMTCGKAKEVKERFCALK